jgi:hypothetical protein
MDESALYFRKKNLLIKYDGIYWFWSQTEKDWIIDEDRVKENWNVREITFISEEEAKKFIKNSYQ